MDNDFPILATVAVGRTHPFGLLQHLQFVGHNATRSTLYRRIDALIASGELRAEEQRRKDGRARRMLWLTEEGSARLKEESSRILEREPLASPLFALALNSADAIQDSELSEVLRRRMSAAARTLTRTEVTMNELNGNADFWTRSSHERQIAHMKADLQWLQSVMRRNDAEAPQRTERAKQAV